MFQIRRRPKHNSNLKFHTLTEKIININNLHYAATLLALKQGSVQYQAVLRQQTNIREGFTNDPETHNY